MKNGHSFEIRGRLSSYSTRLLQIVRRQRGKPTVLDWTTHREMVKALPIARRDSEHLVNWIIEIAANPSCTNSHLFCLEVQYLSHKTSFSEQIAVEAGTVGDKAVQVVCQHCKAERPIPRNILPAGDARGQTAVVPFFEKGKWKARWTRCGA